MVNARERWHRVQELCEALEAVPAPRHAAVLETIEPNPGLRVDTLALLRAFAEEARLQRSLSGKAAASSSIGAAAPAFIGHYRIARWLGTGGSGDVFHAIRTVHGVEQSVAVKRFVTRLTAREHLERFIRDQRVLAGATPENVPQFIDAGWLADGQPFVVTELVEGEPITDYCDRHRLPVSDRLRLVRHACRAVQTAHQHLIVHLDLKPSNILVTPDARIKLLDFGTATLVDGAHTATRMPSLTLLYASPEQLRGAPPSAACDVYSLGLILYELVSGAWPFDRADTIMSVANRAVGHSDPLPLDRTPTAAAADLRRASRNRLTQQLQGELDAICRKALMHDPRDRYATVAELAEDLRRFQAGEPVLAHPDSRGYRFSKLVKRHAWGLAAAATIAVTSAALGVGAVRDARTAANRATATSQFLTGVFAAADATDHAARSGTTVRELLALAESRIGRTVGGDAIVAAEIEHALGAGFASQRGFHEALGLYERAQARAAAAGDLPLEAESRARASYALYALNRPDEAWAEATAALGIWERASRDFSTAQSLNTLVEAAATLSAVKPASPAPRPYYEACIALTTGAPPALQGSRARCLLGLATSLTNVDSRYADAEPLLAEALVLERADPSLTGLLAGTLQMRGLVSRYLGQFANDERAQREAYDVIRRRQGAESPAAVWQRAAWATSLAAIGRIDDADREAHSALAAARGLVPAAGTSVLSAPLSSVMTTACLLSRTAECEAVSREVIAMLAASSATDDARLASAQGFLGVALARKGQCGEARPLIEGAIRMQHERKHVPPYGTVLTHALTSCIQP